MTFAHRIMAGMAGAAGPAPGLTYLTGFNFRRLQSDGPGELANEHWIPASKTYPQDENGRRFGIIVVSGGVNDGRILNFGSETPDRRFYGYVNSNAQGEAFEFRINLPLGTYTVEAAIGRHDSVNWNDVALYDHTSLISGTNWIGQRNVYRLNDMAGNNVGPNGTPYVPMSDWIAASIENQGESAAGAVQVTLANAGDGDGSNLRVRLSRSQSDNAYIHHLGIWQ